MTLVELLVAMTISLVISAMIILSWVALSGSYANTVRRGKASDFARQAMDRMEREVRDAELPPENVSEASIVRARPFYVVFYTTFNKAGNAAPTTPPRLVMYRLYGDGELWRFHHVNGTGGIESVVLNLDAPLGAREAGEGAQLMVENVVNLSTPSTSSPTELFTYIYYGTNGNLVVNDHDGLTSRESLVQIQHRPPPASTRPVARGPRPPPRRHSEDDGDERSQVMREIRGTRAMAASSPVHDVRLRAAILTAAALLAVALMAAVAAGCGGESSPSLEGTSWKLTGWSISSQDPNDFTITAEFKDGRIGGTSAVNTYGGPYSTGDDGSFSVGELVSTMMAGPEPDMQAETSYMTLLAAAKEYQVDGETLTLLDAGGNESLIYTTSGALSGD